MATHTSLTDLFTDIADSIREKTGSTELIVADEFPNEIINIPSGGGGIPEFGVFFMDYDGSLVESWETSTVSSKTELPANPSHEGLIAQGWNWSLNEIKNYITDYSNAKVYVGQMYATSSGLTEIDIIITEVTGLTVTCKMVGNKNWGDGTTDNLTTHTYENYGNYTITCNGTSIPAGSTSSGGMFGSSSSNVNGYWCTNIRVGSNVTSFGKYSFSYCHSLNNITIPNSVITFGTGTFQNCCYLQNIIIPNTVNDFYDTFANCYSLQNISLPNSVTSFNGAMFQNCYSLQNVTLPNGATSLGRTFQYCYSLQNIIIPNGVTSFTSATFGNCCSLRNITIPNSVTSFGNYTFRYCYALENITLSNNITSFGPDVFLEDYNILKYDFSNYTSIPTIDSNSFRNINYNAKIVVPDALYDEWIVATNWSTYANYIVKASEYTEE